MASLTDIPAFTPINFVSVLTEMHRLDISQHLEDKSFIDSSIWSKLNAQRYKLPELGDLTSVVPFCDIFCGWSNEGLTFSFKFDDPFQCTFFPRFERGNAIEIFIDTRDNKKAKVPGRYCHQFLFLPKEADGTRARELSRFRGEEKHDLCQDSDLTIEADLGKKLTCAVFIPKRALFGYDPIEFPKLGLALVLHAPKCTAQYFGPSPAEYTVASHPSLWTSVNLV
jgi:hypothetical protein